MEFGDNTKDEKTLFCFILHQMVSLFHGVGCSFMLIWKSLHSIAKGFEVFKSYCIHLLSFLFFLLPFWVTCDEFQSQIPFPFLRILLGGSFLFDSNGLESSFYFRSNLPLFFTIQFLVLGAICSLLSYGNWKIITLSICLLGLGIIGIALSPLFIFWINPSVPVSSLRFGYGFYLWLAVLLLLLASLLGFAIFLKGKSKKKVTKNWIAPWIFWFLPL